MEFKFNFISPNHEKYLLLILNNSYISLCIFISYLYSDISFE